MEQQGAPKTEPGKSGKFLNILKFLFCVFFTIGALLNLYLSIVLLFGVENYHKADPVEIYEIFESPKYGETNKLLDETQYLLLYGLPKSGILNFVEHEANLRYTEGKPVVFRDLKENFFHKHLKQTKHFIEMYLGEIGRGHHSWFIILNGDETPDREIESLKKKYPRDSIILISSKKINVDGFVNHKFPALKVEELKDFMEKDIGLEKKEIKQILNFASGNQPQSIFEGYKKFEEAKEIALKESERLEQEEEERLRNEEKQKQSVTEEEESEKSKKKYKKSKGKKKEIIPLTEGGLSKDEEESNPKNKRENKKTKESKPKKTKEKSYEEEEEKSYEEDEEKSYEEDEEEVEEIIEKPKKQSAQEKSKQIQKKNKKKSSETKLIENEPGQNIEDEDKDKDELGKKVEENVEEIIEEEKVDESAFKERKIDEAVFEEQNDQEEKVENEKKSKKSKKLLQDEKKRKSSSKEQTNEEEKTGSTKNKKGKKHNKKPEESINLPDEETQPADIEKNESEEVPVVSLPENNSPLTVFEI